MKASTLSEKELNTEGILIDLAKKNPESFRALYEKYYKQVFRFVYHKILDKDITADITSNVFIKAMTNLENYNFKSLPFSAWLYRIAYNESMLYFRKAKREQKVVINEDILLLVSEEKDENLELLKEKFRLIFENMDIKEIEFIQLRFYEGLSFFEIGNILGITENYAKVKTHRILEKIRHRYRLINN